MIHSETNEVKINLKTTDGVFVVRSSYFEKVL